VMNDQRGVVYKLRDDLMTMESLHDFMNEIIADSVENICETNIPEKSHVEDWNFDGIHGDMLNMLGVDITDLDNWKTDETITEQKAYDALLNIANARYQSQYDKYGDEMMRVAERQMTLSALDSGWRKHLQNMDYLQTGIGLRGYAQKNPLYEYKKESFELFRNMMIGFKSMSVNYVCRMELNSADLAEQAREQTEQGAALNSPSHGYDEASRADMDDDNHPGAQDSAATPPREGNHSGNIARNGTDKASGRNDPCPCGSGLKYKHCHGKLK